MKTKIERKRSAQEIASILSVNERTVRRWVGMGCPHSVHNGKLFFNEGEVAAWMKAKEITGQPGRKPQGARAELLAAKIRKENALASKYELEYREAKGRLISRLAVERGFINRITAVRRALLAMGRRLAPTLRGESEAEIARQIEADAMHICNSFAAGGDGIPAAVAAKSSEEVKHAK